MKIVIAGGSGFLGNALAAFLLQKYHTVVILTRGNSGVREGVSYINWDARTVGSWTKELEQADVLINLTGKSVDCRYNKKNREEILSSRLDATQVLGNYLRQHKTKIKLWMNAASATIYGHSLHQANGESSTSFGDGFSVNVCKRWEAAFFQFSDLQIRQVALRISIVLGESGGVMKPFKLLSKLGLGGAQAGGKQMFSWIEMQDFCRAIEFIMDQEPIVGPVNMASPNPITNAALMRLFRKKYAPLGIGIPQPKWLLEMGATIIRTETELILKSRFVIPEKLLQHGFAFNKPMLDAVLDSY